MRAALEVEPQGHRLAADPLEPLGRGRGEVERHHELALLAGRVQVVAEQRAATQLLLRIADAQQSALGDSLLGDHLHAARLQDVGKFLE